MRQGPVTPSGSRFLNFGMKATKKMARTLVLAALTGLFCSLTGGAWATSIYIHSTVGEPWGRNDNLTAMNDVFGSANVETRFYETLDVGATFSPSNDFVFMTGGDTNATELYSFMAANSSAVETWVNNGGGLFITAAPNEGSGGGIGFGGAAIADGAFGDGIVTDASHPVFGGTGLTNGSLVDGDFFHHDHLTGLASFTMLMTSSVTGDPILATRDWGSGRVTLGTLSANFFVTHGSWDQPQSHLILVNTLRYTGRVPEPSSVAFVGLGGLSILLRRRR